MPLSAPFSLSLSLIPVSLSLSRLSLNRHFLVAVSSSHLLPIATARRRERVTSPFVFVLVLPLCGIATFDKRKFRLIPRSNEIPLFSRTGIVPGRETDTGLSSRPAEMAAWKIRRKALCDFSVLRTVRMACAGTGV